MYDAQTEAERVMEQVALRSRDCERGVLDVDAYEMSGLVLIAPDCVQFSVILIPGINYISDVVLN